MRRTECIAVPPQRHPGNVSIRNRQTVFNLSNVTDRDLSALRLTFVSICNTWVEFWPLDVTDRDILQPCRQTSKSVTVRQVFGL